MIEKMRFLSITGQKNDIDRMVEKYLSHYEFQIENALEELNYAQSASAFTDENPYKIHLQKIKDVTKSYSHLFTVKPDKDITVEEAAEAVEKMETDLTGFFEEKKTLKEKEAKLIDAYNMIEPFIGLNYEVPRILHFTHIKYSFGRMPVEYFQKFNDYIYDSADVIIKECGRDKHFVYFVYFVPAREEDRIDAIFASMYFEKIFIPDQYEGKPEDEINRLHEKIKEIQAEIYDLDMKIAEYFTYRCKELLAAEHRLERYAENYEIRKYAACIKNDSHSFYIVCGWMTDRDAKRFLKEVEDDSEIFVVFEKDDAKLKSVPPTKLKHGWFFKPFEMYMEMYGLPSYHEIDPTPLLGLTYTIFFGFMFGDLGQGALLAVIGALLYHYKHMKLAGIISRCGISSMFFGLMFGSVFGFEGLIEPLWLNPQQAMTNLPFIGKLNTVFVAAIAIGMGMILLCMVLNIINGFKQKDKERAVLSSNGIAGLIFYLALTVVIVLFMTGHSLPAVGVMALFFGIPLLVIFFKEPIMNLLNKKSDLIEGGMGMFLTQGFFELFETLLSYFSNTLSFVRIGAFAVSHAAMMGVVMMLAGVENGTEINWLIVVLGNLFVCGMEGLIVGIQVLRLEYYELFSRFYTGGGRAFVPYGKRAAK